MLRDESEVLWGLDGAGALEVGALEAGGVEEPDVVDVVDEPFLVEGLRLGVEVERGCC